MSAKLMGAVWELDLPHHEQNVLLALADHGRDDGSSVYPSVGYLAWKTGQSERNVQRLLRALEARAIIEPVGNIHGGRGQSVEYRIHTENGVKKAPYEPAKGCHNVTVKKGDNLSKGDKTGIERVTKPGLNGDNLSPAINETIEPSIEPFERENARATESQNLPPSAATQTMRQDTPRAVTVQQRNPPRYVPPEPGMVDLANPNDPRFQTPYYPAVARACGLRVKPLDVSARTRGQIAYYAAEFERLDYSTEQIAAAVANWKLPNPPTPQQLFDKIDSLLPKTGNGTSPEELQAMCDRIAAKRAAREAQMADYIATYGEGATV